MRLPPLAVTAFLITTCTAGSLAAAVSIDIDATRARDLPLVAAVRSTVLADPPPRLEMLQLVTGQADPLAGVSRVLVTWPGPGTRPTLRVKGLPAQTIAAAMSLRCEGVATDAGTAWIPPARPGVGFLALAADEALIGPVDGLSAAAKLPWPAAPTAIVHATGTPGPLAPEEVRDHVTAWTLDVTGPGAAELTVTAVNDAAARTLLDRFEKVKHMLAVGAADGLEGPAMATAVLAASPVRADGATITATITIPAEVAAQVQAKVVDRVQRRLALDD